MTWKRQRNDSPETDDNIVFILDGSHEVISGFYMNGFYHEEHDIKKYKGMEVICWAYIHDFNPEWLEEESEIRTSMELNH